MVEVDSVHDFFLLLHFATCTKYSGRGGSYNTQTSQIIFQTEKKSKTININS